MKHLMPASGQAPAQLHGERMAGVVVDEDSQCDVNLAGRFDPLLFVIISGKQLISTRMILGSPFTNPCKFGQRRFARRQSCEISLHSITLARRNQAMPRTYNRQNHFVKKLGAALSGT